MKYKIDENNHKILLWWNGEKWLGKEYCESEEMALALKAELESRDA